MDHLDLLGPLVRRESKEQKDHEDLLDHGDSKVKGEHLDLLVVMVCLEHKAHQVLTEHQELMEMWGHQDQKDHLVTVVQRVHQERKECLEHQDLPVLLDLPA